MSVTVLVGVRLSLCSNIASREAKHVTNDTVVSQDMHIAENTHADPHARSQTSIAP
jgi:hypothetical protein